VVGFWASLGNGRDHLRDAAVTIARSASANGWLRASTSTLLPAQRATPRMTPCMREAIELLEFGWDQGALRDIAGAIKRRLPSRRGLHLFAGGFDGLGIVV
jgi:hypothetical protein